jgi:toxin ParE1/3/4
MASYGFHAEAAEEYLAATLYYVNEVSPVVAVAFVAEIEAAIHTLLESPITWPVAEEPQIRRYTLKRFPYSIYYRWEPEVDRVSIYAVMHFSRLPRYWQHRVT